MTEELDPKKESALFRYRERLWAINDEFHKKIAPMLDELTDKKKAALEEYRRETSCP